MVLTTTCSIYSRMNARSGVIRATICNGNTQPDQSHIEQTNRRNRKTWRYLEDASLHLQVPPKG